MIFASSTEALERVPAQLVAWMAPKANLAAVNGGLEEIFLSLTT
jgi:hypothetical protein